MQKIATFRELIIAWGLPGFAADISVSENTAKQMRTRNSVHWRHWPAIIEKAPARGLDIDQSTLMEMAKATQGESA